MFWSNLLQDLNYDFAHVIRCAVKMYEEIVDTFSSFNVFEYKGQPRTSRTIPILSHAISPSITPTESKIDMVDVDLRVEQSVDNDVDEDQWCVIHSIDWNYEDNLSFDSSPSI